MVRILILHYSQTGQLTQAVRAMMAPLQGQADVELVWQNLEPQQPFPFPWPFMQFFDTFPECVYQDAPALKPLAIDPQDRFDLVILAYQVWFLSPSLPISAFLQSQAAQVLNDTPVITFIACRNMWLSAQQTVQARLQALGATLIDNVVLIDQGPAWATFVTTPRWLLTGKRDGFWGIFPPAGVSQQDIQGAERFGRALKRGLALLQSKSRQPLLSGLGAVQVNPRYIAGEKLAYRSFLLWGKLLRKLGKPGQPLRRVVLHVYIVFLLIMILTVMPMGMLLRAALRPFMRQRLDEQVRQLELPSGSATDRMAP